MKYDVRLRVECSLPARFLQQAVDSGACLYNVRISNRRLTVDCSEASAAILLRLCEAYRQRARVLRRRGIRKWAAHARKRWTFCLGILLGIFVCVSVLCRVWIIEVAFSGAYVSTADEQEIRRCVESAGVFPGVRRRLIDTDALGKEITAETGKFSHVGVRLNGIFLRIEVVPETPAPETYALSEARDLAASHAGIVESVFVRSGEPCVSAGETVLPGQTLIRGDERAADDATTPVSALGSVIARCWFEGSAQAATESVVRVRTGNTRVESALRLFGHALPLTECAPFEAEETVTEPLPVVGVFLPLEVCRTVHYETCEKTVQSDPDTLKRSLTLLAKAQARAALESETDNYTVLSEWTDVENGDEGMRVRAVIEAAVDIAVPHDALN